MALAANALATLEDVKSYLGLKGTVDDPELEGAVNRVSERIETYLGFPVVRQQFTNYRMWAVDGQYLYPPAAPIDTSVAVQVWIDEIAQTVWKTTADDPRAGKDVLVISTVADARWRPNCLFRTSGWGSGLGSSGWGSGSTSDPEPIRLTLKGGFSPVPGDLIEAFLLIVQKYHQEQSKGLQETMTVNTPAGGVTLFDRPIPYKALQILNEWRGFRV